MKQRNRGFSFRGFVALADLIFAVSAGLLLLNPIHFDDAPSAEELANADPATMAAEIQKAEQSLPEIEKQVRELETEAAQTLPKSKP